MLISLVGKPSAGKSTFFKAATLAEVEISPRPFTTLKPNHAIGYVKVDCVDKEFNVQCNPREGYCINNKRFVPIELLDVAGLIEGSHQGHGLGFQFLDDLRKGDILIHIVDISGSTNEKGELVKPLSYDPLKDVKFLEKEINLWYLSILKKGWDKFVKQVTQENQNIKKSLAKQLSGLNVNEEAVEEAIKELKLIHKPLQWSEEDLFQLASLLRKKTKPMLIAANKIDIEGSEYNLHRLQSEFPDLKVIPCSADSELALREASKYNLIKYIPGENDFEIINEKKLSEQQLKALTFIKKDVLDKYGNTGIQQVLDAAVFDFLNYIAVFPGGLNKLQDKDGNYIPDCFLIPKGSTALNFAYRIHTDIGKKFVKAIDVKKRLPVGKNHILKHRDVIEIKTSS